MTKQVIRGAGDGILTPQDQASNLENAVTLLGEHKHLIAGTCLCINLFLVALTQVRLKLAI